MRTMGPPAGWPDVGDVISESETANAQASASLLILVTPPLEKGLLGGAADDATLPRGSARTVPVRIAGVQTRQRIGSTTISAWCCSSELDQSGQPQGDRVHGLLRRGDSWRRGRVASHWYNGYIYANDITRGIDVARLFGRWERTTVGRSIKVSERYRTEITSELLRLP
jgi:hypothetical protein